ncbi:MAG: two-component regulator propeller domain-containing protein [Deltaproteobacteria bacterium]|nr:two-component regulator propeller domain-containing protein [Deltaproteobacteria bacterium]
MITATAMLLLAVVAGQGPAAPVEAPLVSIAGAARNLRFDVPFATEDVSAVFDFAQDRDGAFWLATNNRLIRWDGRSRKIFGPLFFNSVRSTVFNVQADTRDGVWIGFGGRASACNDSVPCNQEWPAIPGLARVVDGKPLPIVHLPDGLDDNVWALAAQGDVLWIGTGMGVVRRLNGRFTRFGTEAGLADPFVTAIAPLANGDVLVGTRAGVQILREGRFGTLNPLGLVREIVEDTNGTRWIATADGLWRQTTRQFATRFGISDGLPGDSVRGVAVDRQGDVWVATDGGLARIVNGKVFPVTVPNLRDRHLVSVGADGEGGIWISSRNAGFVHGEFAPNRHLGIEEGLPFPGATAVSRGGADRMWMAGSDGALAVSDRGVIRVVRAAGALRPRVLASDERGPLWIGDASGISFLAGESVVSAQGDGIARDGVTALAVVGSSLLAVGYQDGRVDVHEFDPRDPAALTLRSRHEGASTSCRGAVKAFAHSSDGTLWIAFAGGSLGSVQAERMRCLNPPGSQQIFTSLAVSANGVVWIGTSTGLVRVQAGKFDRFDESDGMMCDNIVAVLPDGAGHIWTACLGGLSRIDLAELQGTEPGHGFQIHPFRYRTDGGLHSHTASTSAAPSIALDSEGRLWLATPVGIEVIDAPDLARLPTAPRLSSISLFANDNLIAEREPTIVVGTTLKIYAEITALTRPLGARVRYVVTSEDGTTAISRAEDDILTVESTRPGRYVVSVQASSAFGTWSNQFGTRRWIIVQPWHHRPGPWLVFAALAILVAMGSVTTRARQQTARAAAVQEERERLARDLHDSLGQDFASLGYHIEMLAGQIKNSDEAADTLARTRSVLAHAQDDTRRAIWRMRARALLGQRLVDGLHALNDGDSGPGVRCTVDVSPQFEINDPQIEGELLQVARESVSNARKHARAKKILIELAQVGENIRLRISDDGPGFVVKTDDYARSGHFGILGMHERLRRLGGTLVVESEPGAGTIVEALVNRVGKPLPPGNLT